MDRCRRRRRRAARAAVDRTQPERGASLRTRAGALAPCHSFHATGRCHRTSTRRWKSLCRTAYEDQIAMGPESGYEGLPTDEARIGDVTKESAGLGSAPRFRLQRCRELLADMPRPD